MVTTKTLGVPVRLALIVVSWRRRALALRFSKLPFNTMALGAGHAQ